MRIGHDDDFHRFMRLRQRRVGGLGHHVEHREVGDHGKQAAAQNNRLAPDLVGQPTEQDEPARADRQRPCHQQIAGVAVDLQHRGQEEQRVELPGVPNHTLAGDHAEQRENGPFGVFPLAECLAQRRFGVRAFRFHFQEGRAFRQLHTDPNGNRQQQHRHNERHAPAPVGEIFRSEGRMTNRDINSPIVAVV